MKASIRVLVANRPRLLRELVLSTLSEQAGISVVREADDERDVPSLVEQMRPDFLLISTGESRKRPALCDALLRQISGFANHSRGTEYQPGDPLLGGDGNSFEQDGGERGRIIEFDAEYYVRERSA